MTKSAHIISTSNYSYFHLQESRIVSSISFAVEPITNCLGFNLNYAILGGDLRESPGPMHFRKMLAVLRKSRLRFLQCTMNQGLRRSRPPNSLNSGKITVARPEAHLNHLNKATHLDILAPLARHKPKTHPSSPGHRHSAVLIPALDRPQKQLLYTKRSRHLKNHAGEISFPGGRIEPGETGWEAALREAEEEIGLPPKQVTYLARLDDVFSPRGFHIECYVGIVSDFQLRINHDEVEHVLYADLDELLDSSLHRVEPWHQRKVHFYDFAEGLVWGVTGQITYHLWRALD